MSLYSLQETPSAEMIPSFDISHSSQVRDALYTFIKRVVEKYFPQKTPVHTEDILFGLLREDHTVASLVAELECSSKVVNGRFELGQKVLNEVLALELNPDYQWALLPPEQRRDLRVAILTQYNSNALHLPLLPEELRTARQARFEQSQGDDISVWNRYLLNVRKVRR